MDGNIKLISELLKIKHPIIVAPMFLISDANMVVAANEAGCTAAIPALNYRKGEELRKAIREIKSRTNGPLGINIITNKSNFRLKSDLQICIEEGVDFYITSLGSPAMVIKEAHAKGKLVFCDVVNVEHAIKVAQLGADAVIAVNKEAGGHAGPMPMIELVTDLRSSISIPIISAGGIARSEDVQKALDAGASGVSVGSIFIASTEAPVSAEYKEGIVEYGAKDIVMTTRLSGTPCTVINTTYVQETGLQPTWMEKMMKYNKHFKKFFKMVLFLRGMKQLRKAAFGFSYQKVWCAGPSIEYVKSIRPMKEIIEDLTAGLKL